jgi:hypothetical protein
MPDQDETTEQETPTQEAEEAPAPVQGEPDENPPAQQREVIELSDTVAEEIESRVQKRQELVQEAQAKADEFEEARDEAEAQMDSNQTFMEAVATLNDVDPDEYIYDPNHQALRPMTEQERARQEAQEAQMQQGEEGGDPRPSTAEMDTNEAVLFIRENGAESVQVPEEEDRVLIIEALNEN